MDFKWIIILSCGIGFLLLSRSRHIIRFIRTVFGTFFRMFTFGNSVLFQVFHDDKSKDFFARMALIVIGFSFILLAISFILINYR